MRKMRRYFVLFFVLSAFFFCLGAAEQRNAPSIWKMDRWRRTVRKR